MEKVTKELVDKLVKQALTDAETTGSGRSQIVGIDPDGWRYFTVLTSKLSRGLNGKASPKIHIDLSRQDGDAVPVYVSFLMKEIPLPAKIIQAAANASRVNKDNQITEEEYMAIKKEFAMELDRLSNFVKRDLI